MGALIALIVIGIFFGIGVCILTTELGNSSVDYNYIKPEFDNHKPYKKININNASNIDSPNISGWVMDSSDYSPNIGIDHKNQF